MNKYQKILSKLAKEDMSKYLNASYYSAKKFNKKLFNGFKDISIYKINRILNKDKMYFN